MNSKEFEAELKKLDERFSVVANPNRPGLSNIFFLGREYDLHPVSSEDIPLEVDQSRRYQFPNGLFGRLYALPEIMGNVEAFLKDFKAGKYDGLYE